MCGSNFYGSDVKFDKISENKVRIKVDSTSTWVISKILKATEMYCWVNINKFEN